jgi:hypothetical protein
MDRRDFLRLHRAAPTHAGIVVCTFDPDFEGQARRIHSAIEAIEDLHGRVIRIYRPG